MENNKILDVLRTNIRDASSIEYLLEHILKHIEITRKKDWKVERPLFETLCKKFSEAVSVNLNNDFSSESISETEEIVERAHKLDWNIKNLNQSLRNYSNSSGFRKAFSSEPTHYSISLSNCNSFSREIEEGLMSVFSSVSSRLEGRNAADSTFYNLHLPEKIDKAKVEDLIADAIDIIRRDKNLNQKTKEKIIKRLNDALSMLEKGELLDFWGALYQTVIILGAIGSAVGGVTGSLSFLEAKG